MVNVTVRCDFREPWHPYRNLVRTRSEVRKSKTPVLIGRRSTDEICLRLAGDNFGAWHDSIRGVRHPAADSGVVNGLLCQKPMGSQLDEKKKKNANTEDE